VLEVKITSQFKKDSKKAKKRGKDLSKLKAIIELLKHEKKLEEKHVDHALTGQPYKDCRDCHIEPDWLLIYRVKDETLFLVRNGSHSDLFRP
jgi:mRNA interferase YafQ